MRGYCVLVVNILCAHGYCVHEYDVCVREYCVCAWVLCVHASTMCVHICVHEHWACVCVNHLCHLSEHTHACVVCVRHVECHRPKGTGPGVLRRGGPA